MKDSLIEWTDHTFNPWEGCTKVSPGCANCYAEARDKRFTGGEHWGKGAPRRRTSEANWKRMESMARQAHLLQECDTCGWRGHYDFLADGMCPSCSSSVRHSRPRVFCASLADWLDDEVPIEWLVDFLDLVRVCSNLDFLLLTKRPELWGQRIEAALNWIESQPGWGDDDRDWPRYDLRNWLADWFVLKKAPCNVWIGTTVENQEQADKRILELLKIPAKVRFLSCEPLLGPVKLPYLDFPKAWEITRKVHPEYHHNRCSFNQTNGAILCDCDVLNSQEPLSGIHWVICGGESGNEARPMHSDWARSLRDQCAAAGVPFFFKQWGEWSPREWCKDGGTHAMHANAPYYGLFQQIQSHPDSVERVGAGEGWQAFAKVGKKAAGRLLDGVEHNGFPKVEGGVA